MEKQKKQNYSKDKNDGFSVYCRCMHKDATKFIIKRINEFPVYDLSHHRETDIYCFILSILDLFGECHGYPTSKELWKF